MPPGLSPVQGWRIRYDGETRESVIDGPFAETKGFIAGYTLIQVRSREEALEWEPALPQPGGRGHRHRDRGAPLYELEDFAPSDAIERFEDHRPAQMTGAHPKGEETAMTQAILPARPPSRPTWCAATRPPPSSSYAGLRRGGLARLPPRTDG